MDINLLVETKLPQIKGNFEVIKNHLQEQLKKYDLIVDQDSIKTAKKMATEINKLSKEIDTIRKNKSSELSAPIKDFEAKAKALTSLCQDSRTKLLSQVKVFEDKERDRALELLEVYKGELENKYKIKEGFEIETPFDLAIISNLTKTGLAAKAKKELEKRVLEKKNFQDKISNRLLTLEVECLRAGLKAPLTKENINHFLMDDDESYKNKLKRLIQNELNRLSLLQKNIEKKAKKELESSKEEGDKPKLAQPTFPKPQSVAKPEKTQPKYANFRNNVFATQNDKKTYVVTAVFEVEVKDISEKQLSDALVRKFAKAGFQTIPTVYVEEKQVAKVS